MNGLIAYLLSKKFTKKHVAEKIAELPTGFHIKEAVQIFDDLPTSGNNPGDVREVIALDAFYFWDNDEWRPFHLAISIDEELDEHSPNAVENKAVYAGIRWEKGNGENSIQTKDSGCTADGDYSVAEGLNTLTKSDYSHTEGWETRTIIDTTDLETHGHASHAEGSHTIAKGAASHAEGNTTESIGWYSHAEGSGSVSGGISSHAEGDGAITNNYAEHAEGTYNKSNPSSSAGAKDGTLHSIGIGTSMSNRKNAHEIMQNGDQYIIGIGGYDGTNYSDADTVQDVIDSRQVKDEDATVGDVAIFGADGSTATSGTQIVGSSFIGEGADDASIPTTAWVTGTMDVALDEKQDKYVNVGSGTTIFVDSVEIPELTKIQFLEAYNSFIFGKTVLVLDTLHNDAYIVSQASHRVYDATTELRISINVHNSAFVEYIYDDATDEVTAEVNFYAVSQSDKDYWDSKQDKSTITKTTSNDVVLTNNDTTVITQQLSSLTVGFDLPDDVEEDYVTSVIFKPYDVFIFQMDEPENYTVTWGGDVPSFESNSVYEVVYKVLGLTDQSGNTLISGKWSKVA